MKLNTIYISIIFLVFLQKIAISQEVESSSVVDYHFYKNNLVCLVNQNNTYFLEINKIKHKVQLPLKNVFAIKKDLFGALHIVNKDTACQILFTDSIPLFYENEKESLNKIPNIMLYKKLVDSGAVIVFPPSYNKIKFHNQTIIYFIEKFKNKAVDFLYQYKNIKQLEKAKKIYNHIIAIYNKTIPEARNKIISEEWRGRIKNLEITNDKMRLQVQYYLNVAAKPVYVPFLDYKQNFYILNYSNDSIYNFNNKAQLIKKVYFPFTKIPNLKNQILFDEKNLKAYILKEKKGTAFLQEIDLDKALLLKEIKIPHRFAKNIKINNGFVYYLIEDTDNKLYKMSLN